MLSSSLSPCKLNAPGIQSLGGAQQTSGPRKGRGCEVPGVVLGASARWKRRGHLGRNVPRPISGSPFGLLVRRPKGKQPF